MKTKILITINVLLLTVILIFAGFYLEKEPNDSIKGSYQSANPTSVVQLVIDGNNFTEYLDNKQVNMGTVIKSKSQKNTYILDNGKDTFFTYKNGKDILYFKTNIEDDVILLTKISEVPTYISSE